MLWYTQLRINMLVTSKPQCRVIGRVYEAYKQLFIDVGDAMEKYGPFDTKVLKLSLNV